jgi:hypothetical protein
MAFGIVGGSTSLKTAATGTYTAGAGSSRKVVALMSEKSGIAQTYTITLNGVTRTPSIQKNETGSVTAGQEREGVAICEWLESEITSGAMAYTVNPSGSLSDVAIEFYTVSDAGQSLASGAQTGSAAGLVDGSDNTSSFSLTTAVGDLAFSCIAFRIPNEGSITQPTGWTEDYDQSSGGAGGAFAAAHFTASGTSTAVQWADGSSSGSAQYAAAAIVVSQSGGGGGTSVPVIMHHRQTQGMC